ncbi:NlpC/P60 family protein [Hyphomonas neptunium ATCC 15444]|uniref:NlpC/P60 family protein n=2 Tax=Hyphomonas TaxID=85 RepID=Q0C4F7_HYPNA|nr:MULTISPECIES: NlpC/P60 family protein [Hyphomonas]ABI77531.1 NlpC/P60 family protein [Hyphomonas neptunium ATCC 15444]KCZ96402.1 NlpC/P60 family protein [Hyphomonas hirschiana VP5]
MPEFNDPRLARPEGAGTAFQVSAGATAIREIPAPDGRAVTFALHGEVVDVFREEGEFGLVQCRRDRYTGWALMEALSAPVMAPTHKVSALRTYAFSEPDIKSAPHFMLSLGARVVATGRKEGALIECVRAGWVPQGHLAPLDQFEPDPAGVALRFLEAPYLWGGRESLGLDCTGLTQQAFEACGVLLPRDSDMQLAWAGTEVSGFVQVCPESVSLCRGDLVFWRDHVGILTAPDTLLHANAYHMKVAQEPLAEAIERIEKSTGPVLSVRRIDLAADRAKIPDWLSA